MAYLFSLPIQEQEAVLEPPKVGEDFTIVLLLKAVKEAEELRFDWKEKCKEVKRLELRLHQSLPKTPAPIFVKLNK